MRDAYQEITDYVIEQMEKGNIPWHKPWRVQDVPKNLSTGKEYRGCNVFLLGFKTYKSNYWLGFKQAQEMGGHVKKGEKGSKIVKWNIKKVEVKQPDGTVKEDCKMFPMILTVFNVDQCEGLAVPEEVHREFDPIPRCEDIAANMPNKPRISHGGGRACYSPAADMVKMPPQETFDDEQHYYTTLFHELSHSTGHRSRLNRKGIAGGSHSFGSKTYAQEELVAEMSAAFLSGEAGIKDMVIDNSVAYVQSWIRVFQDNKKTFIQSAQQAQKSADYVLGKKVEA